MLKVLIACKWFELSKICKLKADSETLYTLTLLLLLKCLASNKAVVLGRVANETSSEEGLTLEMSAFQSWLLIYLDQL